jgi:hypothetical protein
MMRMLTVKENLQFSALTRLPAYMSRIDKHAFINAVLHTLNLCVFALHSHNVQRYFCAHVNARSLLRFVPV